MLLHVAALGLGLGQTALDLWSTASAHSGVQAFVNVATGGFGTELTVKTDENLKKSMGGAAYVLTGTAAAATSASCILVAHVNTLMPCTHGSKHVLRVQA